ncbi:MAG: hypothetical protein Tsb0013_06520 [Phycisphaerales bacterium]
MRMLAGTCGLLTVAACAGASTPAQDEVRAIVAEMLADAQTRSSLVASPVSVSDNGTFTLVHEDGMTLRVGGEILFRYQYNVDSNDDEGGFQIRRARLDFRGQLRDGITYRVRGDWGRGDDSFDALDIYMGFRLNETWDLRIGQFRFPFDREVGRTGATNLLTIERSILSTMARLDRTQGATLTGTWDRVRFAGSVSDGRRAASTDYIDPDEADSVGLTGRLEFRLGEAGWRQYRRQSWMPGDDSGAMIGLAGHWQRDGRNGRPAFLVGETTDLYMYTADVGFGGDGGGVLLAASGRTFDADADSVSDWGVMGQGSYFVTDEVELYARYAHLFPGERPGDVDDDFGALTVGGNWYPLGGSRTLRLSAEVTWYPQTQANIADVLGAPDTSINLLPDDDGGQVAFTLQAQIAF